MCYPQGYHTEKEKHHDLPRGFYSTIRNAGTDRQPRDLNSLKMTTAPAIKIIPAVYLVASAMPAKIPASAILFRSLSASH